MNAIRLPLEVVRMDGRSVLSGRLPHTCQRLLTKVDTRRETRESVLPTYSVLLLLWHISIASTSVLYLVTIVGFVHVYTNVLNIIDCVT